MVINVSFWSTIVFIVMGAAALGGLYVKMDNMEAHLTKMDTTLVMIQSDISDIKVSLKVMDYRVTKLEKK